MTPADAVRDFISARLPRLRPRSGSASVFDVLPLRSLAAFLSVLCCAHAAMAEVPSEPASPTDTATAAAAPASLPPAKDGPDAGLILLGGGAALLATTASGFVLLDSLTTPDDDRKPQDSPELVQFAGFGALTLASISAGLMLLGGGMLLVDEDGNDGSPGDAPPPARLR